jgi:hypothetical protein
MVTLFQNSHDNTTTQLTLGADLFLDVSLLS